MLQLQVLIHAYITNTWEGMELLRSGNQTWTSQTQQLINDGLLEPSNSQNRDTFYWSITPKGKFWLEYISTVPYPIQKWEIPNE